MWIIVIIGYVVVSITLTVLFFVNTDEYDFEGKIRDFPAMPKYIYDNLENINWFGAILLWVLCVIFMPLLFIGYFIFFIFTVGRR